MVEEYKITVVFRLKRKLYGLILSLTKIDDIGFNEEKWHYFLLLVALQVSFD